MKFLYGVLSLLALVATFYLGQKSVSNINYSETEEVVAEPINTKTAKQSTTARSVNSPKTVTTAPLEVKVIEAERAMISLFENAAPSVCFINTSALRKDYWSRNVSEIPLGSGSGFIWDSEGHIITNYHVVEKSDRATVTLADQKVYQARVIGMAPEKDLAVLKIDAPDSVLRPLPLGESHNLKVGQTALAIGNPFGLDQTLTTGVVSALGREIKSLTGRPIRDVIQTDAAINPGNSGGPLLDSNGKLIGVNTQIYSPSGASAGIGFSIPVDEVRWVVPDLIKYGKVKRPVIGVSILPAQYSERLGVTGVMIAEVFKGGPADQAGLKALEQLRDGSIINGDVITEVNGRSVKSYNDLVLSLEKFKPGETVLFLIEREGKKAKVNVKLGAS